MKKWWRSVFCCLLILSSMRVTGLLKAADNNNNSTNETNLIDQEGKPVRRYGPWDKPEKIGQDIQALLG